MRKIRSKQTIEVSDICLSVCLFISTLSLQRTSLCVRGMFVGLLVYLLFLLFVCVRLCVLFWFSYSNIYQVKQIGIFDCVPTVLKHYPLHELPEWPLSYRFEWVCNSPLFLSQRKYTLKIRKIHNTKLFNT